MNEPLLDRARRGDQEAFRQLTGPHVRELQVHVYRMVGSVQDAEDLVQETLLAAWRGLGGFAGRSSLRTWLYQVATNRSLDALRAGARRGAHQYEPYPDWLLDGLPDSAPGPEARYEQKEALTLAFVAGLMRLPEQQRAAVVLRDVLGFRAAETADLLGTSADAVNSLLRRARDAFETRPANLSRAALPESQSERDTLDRLAAAFEAGDIDGVVELLTDDAWLTMPPLPWEFQGPAPIGAFLHDRQAERGTPLRLVPTRASGGPAFGCHVPAAEGGHAVGLLAVSVNGDRVEAMTWFGDPSVLARFGLTPAAAPRG